MHSVSDNSNTLSERLEMHIRDTNTRIEKVEDMVCQSIQAQNRCTDALEKLVSDTHGVVEFYKTAESAVTIGVAAQKFGLWLTKWPLIGAGLYAIVNWIKDYF